MLEVFINFICGFLMALLGFYVIKRITGQGIKFTKRILFILLINGLVIAIIHSIDYQKSYILKFITNIITYKAIFKNRIEESIIQTGILMLLVIFADMSLLPIISSLTPLEEMENNIIIYLASNIAVFIVAYIIIKIKYIAKLLTKSYKILIKNNLRINIIFIILVIVAISGAIYSIFTNYAISINLIGDMIVVISIVIIGIIFVHNRECYDKLANEYDNLSVYIRNFEDWIEKEQFTRHEYKNQLAVIYSLSNEKSVKDKVQEIIKENINIEGELVYPLKVLPKGGLKGLMYYKTIIAQNNKIKLTIDVSINDNGILHKLNKKQMSELTKVIGIFYDNAIEAAKETRKKSVMIEIYELKDKVNIVISNTFKKNNVVNDRFGKGVSSKGKGRGNGLYFAKKVLSENSWIQEKQEIIDNYYIETLTILKRISKK